LQLNRQGDIALRRPVALLDGCADGVFGSVYSRVRRCRALAIALKHGLNVKCMLVWGWLVWVLENFFCEGWVFLYGVLSAVLVFDWCFWFCWLVFFGELMGI